MPFVLGEIEVARHLRPLKAAPRYQPLEIGRVVKMLQLAVVVIDVFERG